MSKKENTARSFAEEGLEQINEEAQEAAASIPVTQVSTTADSDDDEELQQVGGLEPISLYYRMSPPKKTPKQPFKVLAKGDVITGRYERSFITGKYKNPTYVVREADGKLVGVPSAGNLKKAMAKLAEGSKVKIVYEGMSTIKSGEYAGNDAHNFTVFGSKLKA